MLDVFVNAGAAITDGHLHGVAERLGGNRHAIVVWRGI